MTTEIAPLVVIMHQSTGNRYYSFDSVIYLCNTNFYSISWFEKKYTCISNVLK